MTSTSRNRGKTSHPTPPTVPGSGPATGGASSAAIDRVQNKFHLLLLCSVIAVLLLCFLVLVFYSCPVSDDYIRAGRDKSMFAFLVSTYLNWSGRLASHALEGAILPGIDVVAHYPVLIFALSLLQLLGLYAFWRLLLDRREDRVVCLVLAAATMAVLWSGLPSTAQSIYWFTGAVENQLPSALIALLIWGAVALTRSTVRAVHRCWGLVALAVFCLIAAAMHELYAIVLCGILATAVAISMRLRTGTNGMWAALLCVALLGTTMVVAAPGNRRRAEVTAEQHEDWPTSLVEHSKVAAEVTLRQVKRIALWFADPRLLAMSLVFALSPRIRRASPCWYQKDPALWKWIVPAASVVLLSFMVVAPCWSLCSLPAPRTLGAAYTVFLLAGCATVFVWTRPTAGETCHPTCGLIATLHRGAIYAAIVALLATGNGRSAIRDLLQGKAKRCREAVFARDRVARLRKAQGCTHVDFQPLPSCPESFWVWNDIVSDEACPRNRAVAKYYGFNSVSLTSEGGD